MNLRFLSLAVALIWIPTIAHAQPEGNSDWKAAEADNNLGFKLFSRCQNAMDARNFVSASVYCQGAAEHFGDAVDEWRDEDARDDSRAMESLALALAGVAHDRTGDASDGHALIQSAREIAARIRGQSLRAKAERLITLTLKVHDKSA